jgi:hypothetical protein
LKHFFGALRRYRVGVPHPGSTSSGTSKGRRLREPVPDRPDAFRQGRRALRFSAPSVRTGAGDEGPRLVVKFPIN